jgi:replicative DNA helicase
MIEHSILKLFISDSELFDKYNPVLKLDYIRENYPILYKCYKCLPATSLEALEAKFLTNYPATKDGDRQALRTLLESIDKADTAESSVVPYLEKHLTQAWANDVAHLALDVAQGSSDISALDEAIAQRESTLDVAVNDVEFISTDIEELMEQDIVEGGLTWRLKCLNQSLGPLRKGNFGHIFARVNTGKTALWVSEVTHMVQQVDKPILIFFNEEQGRDVVYRMYNAITGMTYLEMTNNTKRAKQIWDEKIGDKIRFIDDPSMVNKITMEKIIKQVEPALIIIDNMDKVKGFSGDRKDLLLHEIYKWGRDLAKTYCPVITIGQADNTGHNSKVIDESQMADSKTAKPSEMDFIIGIGREDKEGYENMRYITVSKNKLRGDNETIEEMRHMRGKPVKILTQYSIYEDK